MTTTQQTWMQEAWPNGVVTRYEVTDALHDEQTPFQDMQIVDTEPYGRMLVLDGFVQTTERDEFIYHEMMAHVPLLAHPEPKNVLVIGGGDGGILREVLRHDAVQRAVMVEIDQRVIDFSRRMLPSICAEAFDDPRCQLVIDDGAEFVARTDQRFDVIIVDSPDPVGPAEVLFSETFYRNLARCLADGGVMVRQTGSTFMQPDELPQAVRLARPLFEHVSAYTFAVPTYVGGLFSAMFASNGPRPADLDYHELTRRFDAISGEFGYYNPGVHLGAFHLPGYVAKRLDAAQPAEHPMAAPSGGITFGWELQLDLYDCDPERISSEQAIQDYARKLCQVIEMTPYGQPQTPYFGENAEHTKGYSLLQFIETSSITGHFSEGTGGAYLNIFSCKAFDAETAKRFSAAFFGAKRVVAKFTTRQ
jgi:spermidine synthase